MSFDLLKFCGITLILFTIIYWWSKNDEFPFLIAIFFYMTGIKRYEGIYDGEVNWVRVNYAGNADRFHFSFDHADQCLTWMLLGSILLIFTYTLSQSKKTRWLVAHDSDDFKKFILKYSDKIFYGFIFFLIFNSFFSGLASGASSMGNSYFSMLKYAIGGFILLLYLVWENINYKKQAQKKIAYAALIFLAASIAYNPHSRFTMISWMVALAVLSSRKWRIKKKARNYLIGGITFYIFISFMGAAREPSYFRNTPTEMLNIAVERATKATDENMLDGFIMLEQVYPKLLDHRYGMEHLEIFMRPIPRKLWPGKPLGGYANKLGWNDYEGGSTTGISPSLYGSFYAEGAVIGIVIFSVLYGLFFSKVFKLTAIYIDEIRWLVKGIVLASIIVILRGGDLPGIAAFIGMSFWPVFLFIYLYRKQLKKSNER